MSRSSRKPIETTPARHALIENLEQRSLMFAYSPQEVYLLELVNRARANPQAEGVRLGIDLTQSLSTAEIALLTPKEPLALNPFLTLAARAHSADMGARDFFSHINPDGKDPTNRAVDSGYPGQAGENIAAGFASIDLAHRSWVESVSHRRNLFSLYSDFDSTFHYSEFGSGSAFPTGNQTYTSYYTQMFGIQATPTTYILGVVFDDTSSDNFYSIGEGRANVRIDVYTDTNQPLVGTFITDSAGNYQIPVTDGSYAVVFTDVATGLGVKKNVTVAGNNVKVDARGVQMTSKVRPDNLAGSTATISGSAGNTDQLTITALDRDGDPIVFRQSEGGLWTVQDLSLITGTGKPTGQLVSWVEPTGGLTHAAVTTAAGVQLFINDPATNAWAAYNLTTLVVNSAAISGELTVFHDAVSSNTFLAGRTASGDLVLYVRASNGGWSFGNITQSQLVPNNQQTPDFQGQLVGYATTWGALNIAGLDADGQLQAVWWSPGMAAWTTSNLSANTGAPAMIGGLSVYLTAWGGMNLAGIDENGELNVTWWSPGMETWAVTNMNQAVGGPHLTPASISSYVTPWGGLNIAGLDSSGKIHVFWWGGPDDPDGWAVTPLTDFISGAPILSGSVRGVTSPAGTTSLVGAKSTGEVVRFWWRPGAAWEVENITSFT